MGGKSMGYNILVKVKWELCPICFDEDFCIYKVQSKRKYKKKRNVKLFQKCVHCGHESLIKRVLYDG